MRRAVWFGALALLLLAARSDTTLAARSVGDLRIAFAGDTHGFGIVDDPALQNADLLAGTQHVLGKADLFVFNHEGTLIRPQDEADNCRDFDNQSTFATPPDFALRLDAGLPAIAALGNNHAMDCGAEGLQQTLLAFAEAGIDTVGAGNDLEEACAPLELSLKGVRIAVFSYLTMDPDRQPDGIAATESDPGVATLDACEMHASIKAYAADHLVIVMLHSHWGSSWRYGVSADHLGAVYDLFDAGADLVASSGPHYPQGVVVERRNIAFMGLGDFMFNPGYTVTFDGRKSFLALAEVERGRVARAWLYPFYVNPDGLPYPPTPATTASMLNVVTNLSDSLGTSVQPLSGLALVPLPRATSAAR